MRKEIALLCILACILILGMFIGNGKKNPGIALHILLDETDHHKVLPTLDVISELLLMDDNIWQGVRLKFSLINQFSQGSEYLLTLKQVSRAGTLLEDEVTRTKQVREFLSQMDSILTVVVPDSTTQNHSFIYGKILSEVTELASSPMSRKILLVYSDLIENSHILNGYSLDITSANAQKKVIKAFEDYGSLSSLDGIEIWLIYQPTSINTDQRFVFFSGIYKKLFEQYGAKVYISGSGPRNLQ